MSQPIDIVQRSLPEPELLVLDAVEQIERDIVLLFSGFEVGEGLDVRAVRDRKFLITAPMFAACAICPGRGSRCRSR